MAVLNILQVSKQFGNVRAVSDISLSAHRGEIYGFIGLNGAGKTTLIRILLGMIQPDRGSVFLFDQVVNRKFPSWNRVGYLVETPQAYPELTAFENLKHYFYLRELNDLSVIDEVIEFLGLKRLRDTQARHLSLGNKQRLGLAKAMMHKPDLLILDEPVNALDPEGVVEIRMLLKRLKEAGTTILLSSHNLGEIWKIVDRIGIIHEGILLEERTKEQIQGSISQWIELSGQDILPSLNILTENGYEAKKTDQGIICITGKRALSSPERVIELLVTSGYPPSQVVLKQDDLENYFLKTIRPQHGKKT